MSKIKTWIKNNVITDIAIILSIITCFFVPFDKNYLGYIDYKTIFCLSSILAVVQLLKDSMFFSVVSKKIVYLFKNTRSVILALVLLTFVCDLVLANDMSLITLLPLTYIVLSTTNNMKYFSFTLILQNIAANMSGMITPHGNPQNLYLYSFYNIDTLEFIKILLPEFFIVLGVLILLPIVFVKKEPLQLINDKKVKVDKYVYVYILMFIFSLLAIFRVINYIVCFIVIMFLTFLFNKKALKEMDWDLILTFIAFFIFSGNASRIPLISSFITPIITKNVLIAGIISCQFISNVPSAILISKFTNDYTNLLISVNVGSLGTIISSLASLITLKEYLKHKPCNIFKYLLEFTLINLLFLGLILLYVFVFR